MQNSLQHGKRENNVTNCPVVTFGGSYGGMLSAWFRMKYPNVVIGAHAASAPILLYGSGVSQWTWNEIATDDFRGADEQCPVLVEQALFQIINMSQTQEGLQQLTNIFSLCQPLNNSNDLIGYAENALGTLAMVDYPYPANFVAPLPAWPVNVFCDRMVNSTGTLLENFNFAMQVFYNYTGNLTCNELYGPVYPTDLAWNYQACTEIFLPQSSNGTSDMFPPSLYNVTLITEQCYQQYQAYSRPYYMQVTYGGYYVNASSNIIFSNGMLDPWRSGGITFNITSNPTLVAIIIDKSAHHLDLRLPNVLDPPSVTAARKYEMSIIEGWLLEFIAKNK